tara:strand:- start:446 stop:670 length:225 start_codon:yes stop_codon:yes gene_type:complete
MLDRIEGVFVLFMAVGLIATVLGAGAAIYKHFYVETTPDNFDSMLCRVHTPMGSLLITDELITCTNGKKYRVAK